MIGEAVRRLPPENAEFLIEITASAPTAAQALRDNQAKTAQVVQAIGALGVQQTDIQTISSNVYNVYSPLMQGLPGSSGMPQIGQAGFSPFATSPYVQPELQFGSYHARNTLRVNVREPGRAGEILDTATRAGATVSGGFQFQVSDEAATRRTLLEAAGRDARAKAETLAAAAGKQIGDPISITEDCIVSNGALTALRQSLPYAFGSGAPRVAGELEYYARVSASFRFQ